MSALKIIFIPVCGVQCVSILFTNGQESVVCRDEVINNEMLQP